MAPPMDYCSAPWRTFRRQRTRKRISTLMLITFRTNCVTSKRTFSPWCATCTKSPVESRPTGTCHWSKDFLRGSSIHYRKQLICEQECIPVGCVPVAHWPYARVCFPGGVCFPGLLLWGVSPSWGGVCFPGGWWWYPSMHWGRPPC